jgi:phosphatidylinositol alpha-1,6-mannosyltransferase
MRVLALVTDAFGGYGGIAQYNRDLLGAMSRFAAAPSVDVLPRYARDDLGELPERVRQHPAQRRRSRLSFEAVRLASLTRPEVVFCGHLHLSPLAAWIARRHRCALVCQTHGVEVWPVPREMRRRGIEAADAVLCVSRDTRARVRTWVDMPPERLRVVPNTVGDEFTPGDGRRTRERLGVGASQVILSVSRLDSSQRHKGQDRIIELMPRLAAEGHDLVYLIAGEGDDIPRLRALADAAGVAARVRFLGRVPQAELPDLYRAADLFALPSTGDGFGIVFLEAMACGVPALGLDAGGAADAFADGAMGFLAREGNLDEALRGALKVRPSAVDISAAVRARFGRDSFRGRLEAVFAAVIRDRATAHGMARA